MLICQRFDDVQGLLRNLYPNDRDGYIQHLLRYKDEGANVGRSLQSNDRHERSRDSYQKRSFLCQKARAW